MNFDTRTNDLMIEFQQLRYDDSQFADQYADSLEDFIEWVNEWVKE